jgi:hypothetical protein
MELFLWIGGVCIVVQLGFYAYLIEALKQAYPEEYDKAGRPWYFWIDHRTVLFTGYVLKAKYRFIPDKNLVAVFNISRVILIVMHISLFLFLVSVFITELN